MLPILYMGTRFTLAFKMHKKDLKKIEELLNDNGFIHSTWVPTAFPAFVEFRVDVNIRRAEIVRNLIHNFKIYE